MSTNLALTYGTLATATITLASLANAAARRSVALSNSSALGIKGKLHVTIKTGASGVAATGYVAVYILPSGDGGTTYAGGGSTDAAFTVGNGEVFLGTFPAIANATTYTGVFDLTLPYGTLPRDYCVVVENQTGAALDSTGGSHFVKAVPETATAT